MLFGGGPPGWAYGRRSLGRLHVEVPISPFARGLHHCYVLAAVEQEERRRIQHRQDRFEKRRYRPIEQVGIGIPLREDGRTAVVGITDVRMEIQARGGFQPFGAAVRVCLHEVFDALCGNEVCQGQEFLTIQ